MNARTDPNPDKKPPIKVIQSVIVSMLIFIYTSSKVVVNPSKATIRNFIFLPKASNGGYPKINLESLLNASQKILSYKFLNSPSS